MQFLLAVIELCLLLKQDLQKSLQQQGFSSLCQNFTVLATHLVFSFPRASRLLNCKFGNIHAIHC